MTSRPVSVGLGECSAEPEQEMADLPRMSSPLSRDEIGDGVSLRLKHRRSNWLRLADSGYRVDRSVARRSDPSRRAESQVGASPRATSPTLESRNSDFELEPDPEPLPPPAPRPQSKRKSLPFRDRRRTRKTISSPGRSGSSGAASHSGCAGRAGAVSRLRRCSRACSFRRAQQSAAPSPDHIELPFQAASISRALLRRACGLRRRCGGQRCFRRRRLQAAAQACNSPSRCC